MPLKDAMTDEGDGQGTEKVRRGQEVVRTTIELEKDLYIRVKEEVARTKTSIRDFISKAASERLIGGPGSIRVSDTGVKILVDAIEKNPFSKGLLKIIEKELPPPFGITLLISKAEKHDLDLDRLTGADLSDELIDELCLPVDHLSGPLAAKRMKKELDGLRRV